MAGGGGGAAELRALTALVALIALAEAVTHFANPVYGLLAHSLLLIALLALSAHRQGPNPSSSLLPALSLAPLVRVVSLSLPLASLPKYAWHTASGAAILAAAAALMRLQGLGLRDVGLTFRRPLAQLALCLAGVPLGALEYLILRPEPLAQGLPPVGCALLALALILFTGLAEELVFRGIMQGAAVRAVGWRAGLLSVNAIFASLHLGWLSALDVAFVFFVGLIFGYVVLKTGSIVGAGISHGLVNVSLFIIVPSLQEGL